MFYGIDALAHGATAALLVIMPALALFWRLTRSIAGPRPLRPFITIAASYGAAVAGSGIWAGGFERQGFADEAMFGALIGGGIAAAVAVLILLLFPRKA